jgi:hypothetical protein
MKTICHRDGTVTYWSAYDQVWKRHEREISDRELAEMGSEERESEYIGTSKITVRYIKRRFVDLWFDGPRARSHLRKVGLTRGLSRR